jgi:hypothetical protein
LLRYPLFFCPEWRDFGAKKTIREVVQCPFGRLLRLTLLATIFGRYRGVYY